MRRTQGVVNSTAAKHLQTSTEWRELLLHNLTPAQAEQWVETNVKDLATAKQVLKLLVRAVVHLARFVELE